MDLLWADTGTYDQTIAVGYWVDEKMKELGRERLKKRARTRMNEKLKARTCVFMQIQLYSATTIAIVIIYFAVWS